MSSWLATAVDEVDSWLSANGVRVQHNRRSNHSIYVGKRRLGGYYFAKGWIHFWLKGRDSADAGLEDLSQPGSLLVKNTSVAGNILNDADLELFKQAVQARLNG